MAEEVPKKLKPSYDDDELLNLKCHYDEITDKYEFCDSRSLYEFIIPSPETKIIPIEIPQKDPEKN